MAFVALGLLLLWWEITATLVAAGPALGVGIVMVVAYRRVRPARQRSANERKRVDDYRESMKRTAASR